MLSKLSKKLDVAVLDVYLFIRAGMWIGEMLHGIIVPRWWVEAGIFVMAIGLQYIYKKL